MAAYSSTIFKHTINNSTYSIFQTVEMLNFKTSLCKENIDKLINEKGLFIAHTYFSVPMNYHVGKLIDKNGTVNEIVDKNFSYLSEKIQNNQIWNPTISELVLFFNSLHKFID
jgi:hypothetical protein